MDNIKKFIQYSICSTLMCSECPFNHGSCTKYIKELSIAQMLQSFKRIFNSQQEGMAVIIGGCVKKAEAGWDMNGMEKVFTHNNLQEFYKVFFDEFVILK